MKNNCALIVEKISFTLVEIKTKKIQYLILWSLWKEILVHRMWKRSIEQFHVLEGGIGRNLVLL